MLGKTEPQENFFDSYIKDNLAMGYVLQNMKALLEDIDVLIDPVSFSQIRRF